jgi:hypothetical protein
MRELLRLWPLAAASITGWLWAMLFRGAFPDEIVAKALADTGIFMSGMFCGWWLWDRHAKQTFKRVNVALAKAVLDARRKPPLPRVTATTERRTP